MEGHCDRRSSFRDEILTIRDGGGSGGEEGFREREGRAEICGWEVDGRLSCDWGDCDYFHGKFGISMCVGTRAGLKWDWVGQEMGRK